MNQSSIIAFVLASLFLLKFSQAQAPVFSNSVHLNQLYNYTYLKQNKVYEVAFTTKKDTLFYEQFDTLKNQLVYRKHLENKLIRNSFLDGWSEEIVTRSWGALTERTLRDANNTIREKEEWRNDKHYKCLEYNENKELINEYLKSERGSIQKNYLNGKTYSLYSSLSGENQYTWHDTLDNQIFEFSTINKNGVDTYHSASNIDGSFTYIQNCQNQNHIMWLTLNHPSGYYSEQISNTHFSYKWSYKNKTTTLDSLNGKITYQAPTENGWIKQEFSNNELVYEEEVFFQNGTPNSPRTKRTKFKVLKDGTSFYTIEKFEPGNWSASYYAHYDGDSNLIQKIKTSFYEDGSIKKEKVRMPNGRNYSTKHPNPRKKKVEAIPLNFPYLPHSTIDAGSRIPLVSHWYRWYPVIDSFPEPFYEELLYFQKGDSILKWTDLRKQSNYITHLNGVLELNLDSTSRFQLNLEKQFNGTYPTDTLNFAQVEKTYQWLKGVTPRYGMHAVIRKNKHTPEIINFGDGILPMKIRWESVQKVNERRHYGK